MNAEAPVVVLQHAPPRPRLLERRGGAALVVLLLTLGALVAPVIGWLVGAVLLWSSHGWRTIDKVLGSAVGLVALGIPLLLRFLVPWTPSTDCSGSGFCAPSLDPAWYQNVSTIGAWLVITHLVLGAYLLLRFHLGGVVRTKPTTRR
ncbi:hypothetical protein GCM10025783_30380 [Amnibacterium soli]|uniref:Major facilitator superfamily (MFS) profile domain-containing protein n=1 Tax=Amnibacterium soli TaxID=1282736 RepID=A0ABP8ZF52_9MICO